MKHPCSDWSRPSWSRSPASGRLAKSISAWTRTYLAAPPAAGGITDLLLLYLLPLKKNHGFVSEVATQELCARLSRLSPPYTSVTQIRSPSAIIWGILLRT